MTVVSDHPAHTHTLALSHAACRSEPHVSVGYNTELNGSPNFFGPPPNRGTILGGTYLQVLAGPSRYLATWIAL